MNKILNISAALAALLLLFGAGAARAQDRPGIAAYLAAADRFDAMTSTSAAPPRLADPAAAALLRRLGDRSATFGGDRYGPADIPTLTPVVRRALRLMNFYLQYGITPDLLGPAATAQSNRNSVELQDEIALLTGFAVEAYQVVLRVADEDVAARGLAALTEGQRESLRGMRQGTAMMIDGLIMMIGAPEMGAGNRRLLVGTLARNATSFSAALSLDQRRRIAAAIVGMRARFPGVGAELDRIAAAMEARACERMCAL